VEAEDLLARLRSALRLKDCQDELRCCNRLLEDRVQERTEELFQSHLDIIWRLGKVAEFRDELAGDHVIRVGSISRAVASSLGMSRRFVEDLFLAAPLHDIGKIAIPDYILRKRGPLSAREWQVMRKHCAIGEQVLREDSLVKAAFLEWRGACFTAHSGDGGNPFLEMAATVALTHHEKWDGSGYPQGLAGQQIPIEARIVAIADVFDALCSRRPYKAPCPEEEAIAIIRASAGSHFDPHVHAAFTRALPEIRAIRQHFGDTEPSQPSAGQPWEELSEEEEEAALSLRP
jgi:putative two-component system response regulator